MAASTTDVFFGNAISSEDELLFPEVRLIADRNDEDGRNAFLIFFCWDDPQVTGPV